MPCINKMVDKEIPSPLPVMKLKSNVLKFELAYIC